MTEQHTFRTQETLQEFYARAYMNAKSDRVLVYPEKIGVGKPQIWSSAQMHQYVMHLKLSEVRI